MDEEGEAGGGSRAMRNATIGRYRESNPLVAAAHTGAITPAAHLLDPSTRACSYAGPAHYLRDRAF
jgi:hypothetical protein